MDLNKIRNYPSLTSTLPSSGSAPLIATAANEEHVLHLRTKKSRPFLTGSRKTHALYCTCRCIQTRPNFDRCDDH
ncbi:hypothetical protein AHF37_00996 [Paragonimus kellicotti]|nr:hypothetical protein AHF37_00996 [Paragonimus kellicotti]